MKCDIPHQVEEKVYLALSLYIYIYIYVGSKDF